MAIVSKQGDLLKDKADAIVNTVNCEGVMGKGIALQFKQKFPENFKSYAKVCKDKNLIPGKLHTHFLGELTGKPYYIINFPTKNTWREKSKLSYIQDGLKELKKFIIYNNIQSIAIPPLGCGNGGLNWQDVKPLIEKTFVDLPNIKVNLYELQKSPESKNMINNTIKPKMTLGRAFVLLLVKQYKLLNYDLGRLQIQKLCYFAEEARQNLNLKFQKNQFGPYSDTLRHVLTKMDGHYLKGVGDNDKSSTNIYPIQEMVDEAKKYILTDQVALERLNKVQELIYGFETPYLLELLSTVHWVVTRELSIENRNIKNIVEQIHSWNDRKKQIMKEEDIEIAFKHLSSKGWFNEYKN